MRNNSQNAFTLVELIVIITILAVLATVAFISFQWYTVVSRDTKRMSDITTIAKWLQIYQTQHSVVPEPSETKTTLSFSGSKLTIQWYAWKSVNNILRISDALDPKDKEYYLYTVNNSKTKYQVTGFLEQFQANILGNKTFAVDYSDRFIYSQWQTVWVLFDVNNTPIQELWNNLIELKDNTTQYKASLWKTNIIYSTGADLKTQIVWAQNNLYWWRAQDPNCNNSDIIIWNQTWAGCNSTLWDGLEWWQTDANIWTDNFSWSINSCFDYAWKYNPSNPSCQPGVAWMLSNDNAWSWIQEVNQNNDREFDTIWWKMYTKDTFTQACPVGWHIPTDDDFTQLETYLNDGVNCTDWGWSWYCDGLGWKWHNAQEDTQNLAKALKIPLAWNRNTDNTSYKNRWDDGFLWTSTAVDDRFYVRWFYQDFSTVHRWLYGDNFATSARCIKN